LNFEDGEDDCDEIAEAFLTGGDGGTFDDDTDTTGKIVV
jgi:hypothetical protein